MMHVLIMHTYQFSFTGEIKIVTIWKANTAIKIVQIYHWFKKMILITIADSLKLVSKNKYMVFLDVLKIFEPTM